uniref:Cyclin-dependent kinases regulatory subunit n=2 Tax=Romanomermis culicivorax TaxID=13658 RepID=A0A915J9M5_ROMCU
MYLIILNESLAAISLHRSLNIDDDCHIVLYDRSFDFSGSIYSATFVWWLFRLYGHPKVTVMNGGLEEWKKQTIDDPDYRAVSGEQQHDNNQILSDFSANWRPDVLVDYQDLISNLKSKENKYSILDTRSQEEFNGISKNDRADSYGKITMAKNVPVVDNVVTKDGNALKSVQEIKKWLATNVQVEPGSYSTVVYGNLPMNASVLYFALTQLGYDARLYNGGWIEWSKKAPSNIILPKDFAVHIPRTHLLTETEWRNLGILQSPGWVHYCTHGPVNSTYGNEDDVSFLGMSRKIDCTNAKVGDQHGLLWFQSGTHTPKNGTNTVPHVGSGSYRTCYRFCPSHIQHYKKAIREIERTLKHKHFTNQSNQDQPFFLCSAMRKLYWPKIKLLGTTQAEEYIPRFRQYRLTGERFDNLLITVIIFPVTSTTQKPTFYECGTDNHGRESGDSRELAESHGDEDEVVEDFSPFNISADATGLFNIDVIPSTRATLMSDYTTQNPDIINQRLFTYSAIWSTSGSSLSTANGSSMDFISNNDFISDGYEVPYTTSQDAKLKKLEICRNRLVYVNTVYENDTKLVFECTKKFTSMMCTCKHAVLNGGYNSTRNHQIRNCRLAVKSLRLNFTKEEATAFRSEAAAGLALSGCLQICRLLGVCFVGRPPCLIFEFVANGDLCNFLRQANPDKRNLYRLHFPRFIKHIATGMRYVAERGFIHRDLAARNCLVDEALNAKVTDFGMCLKATDGSSFVIGDRDEPIPVQWSAPEVHLLRKFSQKSDVWSFGIVVWEIFSFCIRPFYLLSHGETAQALRTALENMEIRHSRPAENNHPLGTLLERPCSTPEFFYVLMKRCLAYLPNERPLFEELCQDLECFGRTEQLIHIYCIGQMFVKICVPFWQLHSCEEGILMKISQKSSRFPGVPCLPLKPC